MYATVQLIAQDPDIASRVQGCIAMEVAANDGQSLSILRQQQATLASALWIIAAKAEWIAAWESALAATRPEGSAPLGADPAIITDGMILAAVKAVRP